MLKVLPTMERRNKRSISMSMTRDPYTSFPAEGGTHVILKEKEKNTGFVLPSSSFFSSLVPQHFKIPFFLFRSSVTKGKRNIGSLLLSVSKHTLSFLFSPFFLVCVCLFACFLTAKVLRCDFPVFWWKSDGAKRRLQSQLLTKKR